MKVLHVFSIYDTAAGFFDGQFDYLGRHGYDLHLICTQAPQMGDFIRRNRLQYRAVEITRSITPLKDLKAVWQVSKYIRQEEVDIVIGHTPKGALIAMLAAFVMCKKRRVYYRHGLIYTTAHGLKRFILKKEEQFVALLAKKIVNVSPSLSALAIREHLNSRVKQQIIGAGTCGGIDTQRKFNPEVIDPSLLEDLKAKFGLRQGEFVIGFCGRLCRDKGIVELVDGFELFMERHPECACKLLLVGPYDERDVLPQNTKKQIENSSRIILTGHIHENIAYYYSMMDVFVFPSYREGFGMSVLEASAMEKPILVSRSHGCVDSIRDGETGFYIELSAASIAKGLDRFVDRKFREKIGINGRKFVCDHFDYQIMWPQVLEMYCNL